MSINQTSCVTGDLTFEKNNVKLVDKERAIQNQRHARKRGRARSPLKESLTMCSDPCKSTSTLTRELKTINIKDFRCETSSKTIFNTTILNFIEAFRIKSKKITLKF